MGGASIVALFLFVIIAATPSSMIGSAEEFIVGDETGWTLFFDYQAWAASKDFHVGDKLVFQYETGLHNVYKVNETQYENCILPPRSEALVTGNDIVNLTTAGENWFICGVHCRIGRQKLEITVKDHRPAPAPTPASLLQYP